MSCILPSLPRASPLSCGRQTKSSTTLPHSAQFIDAPPLPYPAAADPDDDAVLACAIAAYAEVVVSGDGHLLDLSSYAGIPILDVHQFLQRVSTAR